MRNPKRLATIFAVAVLSAGTAFAGNSNFFIEGNPAGKRVFDAQSDVNRAVAQLRRDFEQSSEIQNARSAVRAATRTYTDACDNAVAPLRQTPEYLQLADHIQKLEQKLNWGSYDDRMTDRQRAETSTQLFGLRAARSSMEAKVIANDPSVTSARFAMIDANGQVIALQREFNQSIPTAREYVDAKEKLDTALAQAGDSHPRTPRGIGPR